MSDEDDKHGSVVCPMCNREWKDEECEQACSVALFGECISCRFGPAGTGTNDEYLKLEIEVEALKAKRASINPLPAGLLNPVPGVMYWTGHDGDEYIERNKDDHLLASYTAMWSKILARAPGITRVLEVGANIGTNLNALSWLRPDLEITACEPNAKACEELRLNGYRAIQKPIEELNAPGRPRDVEQFDLVFTRGVLIHIPPHNLLPVLMKMAALTDRYIVVAEYYAPTSQEIEYRGRRGLLWKDDYAGLLLQADKTLRLVDYGFCYRRDPTFPQDDVTWFLLERRA